MTDQPQDPTEQPGELADAADDSPAQAPPVRQRRLFPSFIVLSMVAVGLLAIAAMHWIMGDGDGAIINILTLILGFLTVLPLMIWFVFFSGYLLPLRVAAGLAFTCLLLMPFTLLKVASVDGRLVPTFHWRWTEPADAKLANTNVVPESEKYDLTTTTPDDFPRFLGPDGNSRLPGLKLAKDWGKNPPEEIWRQPVGAGWGGFAVVNGFAVTMEQRKDREMVTCYSVATGKLLWSKGIEARHESIMGGIGPRSTPTIEGGRVYASGATAVLRCLDGSNGELIWKKDLLAETGVKPGEDVKAVSWGRAASPLVVGDLVIVPAGGPLNGDKVSLMAFDKLTGELVWKGGQEQVSYSSPVAGTVAGVEQVVILNESTVAGHDLTTGEELWKEPWPGNSNGDANTAQPHLLSGDRVLVSKGYGGGGLMLKIKKNDAKADKHPFTATEVWRSPRVLRTKLSNLAIYEGHAYGLSDGILQCVDIETGKQQWKRGRYLHGQLLIAGDVLLIIGERDGIVRMIELNPQKMNVLGEFKALSTDNIAGQNWNTLCIAGDKLLVRNNAEAACYRLPLAK